MPDHVCLHTLPNETLSHIFSFTQKDEPYKLPIDTLVAVCRHWCNVVSGMNIWSSLRISHSENASAASFRIDLRGKIVRAGHHYCSRAHDW
jgi:hypothetical protein